MYTFTKSFVVEPLDLFKLMEKYKAVIAGGFAVSIFMGELDENSDIDIYVDDVANFGR